ncbi:MAG TPA: HypC/HybG/HupF family hydrogenase formation chaperone [Thermoanaerobaculia bacterium]|nr:HypC/HybG/HupF family hydrogenase formation chaperone [Thermoanaerobaculia bacterium]
MCLGVPGKVVEIQQNAIGVPSGRVDFGGVVKEVCFAYTPEVQAGEYVVVHVGFAISKIDEAEARRIFDYLTGTGELGAELGEPPPIAATSEG